jgi:hypothetical protein
MAQRLRTSRTSRVREEGGWILVEALVAATILIGGIAATLVAFDSTTRASHTSEREAEAVAIAEKEVERILSKPFAQINDCTQPPAGTGRSDDPSSWVQGTKFFVARNFRPQGATDGTPPAADLSSANQVALEPLAVSNVAGCVPPEEDASTAGVQADSKISHTKIYRFISYRGEPCASNVNAKVTSSLNSGSIQATLLATAGTDLTAACAAMGTQEAKRVTVAVVLNRLDNNAGLRYPVYVSTLIPNPNASLHATGTVIG